MPDVFALLLPPSFINIFKFHISELNEMTNSYYFFVGMKVTFRSFTVSVVSLALPNLLCLSFKRQDITSAAPPLYMVIYIVHQIGYLSSTRWDKFPLPIPLKAECLDHKFFFRLCTWTNTVCLILQFVKCIFLWWVKDQKTHHLFNVLVLNILLHVSAFQNTTIRESDMNMLRWCPMSWNAEKDGSCILWQTA
jgi:hypothetical protein